jgi:hypothetical protein
LVQAVVQGSFCFLFVPRLPCAMGPEALHRMKRAVVTRGVVNGVVIFGTVIVLNLRRPSLAQLGGGSNATARRGQIRTGIIKD